MKCPSCGFEEDAAKYCKQCGAPMITDKKAEYVGAPQYTGITISPPIAREGLKVEDIEEVGLGDEADPHLGSGEMMGGSSSEASNSFGGFLIMAIVVALLIFVALMARQATGG